MAKPNGGTQVTSTQKITRIDSMEEEEDEDSTKPKGYRWTQEFERTWENITEDEQGLRTAALEKKLRKRKQQREARNIRRGMSRHLFIVVDFSKAMNDNDMRPNRLSVAVKLVESFILNYFDQNPLSQLGVIVTKNAVAEKLTELSGNPSKHINALKSQSGAEGEVSLQNALEVARSSLTYVPKYGTREILIVFGSLTTCDPSDIFETIEAVKKENIKCSIVGLTAELYVCRAIADATNGSFFVAQNEEHFKELLFNHAPPPPATAKMETQLISMGFPQRITDHMPTLCVCHQVPKYGGYFCPRCGSKFCELPTDCQICGLTLISSPHLARSYHHLFPVPIYTEALSSVAKVTSCYACLKQFSSMTPTFTCPKCRGVFCSECDDYIHDSLNNCPGCEMPQRVNH